MATQKASSGGGSTTRGRGGRRSSSSRSRGKSKKAPGYTGSSKRRGTAGTIKYDVQKKGEKVRVIKKGETYRSSTGAVLVKGSAVGGGTDRTAKQVQATQVRQAAIADEQTRLSRGMQEAQRALQAAEARKTADVARGGEAQAVQRGTSAQVAAASARVKQMQASIEVDRDKQSKRGFGKWYKAGREGDIPTALQSEAFGDIRSKEDLITSGLFEKTQSIGERYRQKVEGYKEKILTMPEYKDPITKRGIKVVAGAAQLPAGVVELVGATAMGAEIAAREPVESVKALPSVAGLMGGGLIRGVREKPYETAGEFAAFAAVGGVRPKVPRIKGGKLTLEPLDLTGRLRTAGGEYIPPEKLFAPDVHTGKTQFPMTKKGDTISDILGEFATEKRVIRDEMLSGEGAGFHATGVQLGGDVRVLNPKLGDIARGSDVGGLYISPTGAGASKHFLRTGIEQRRRTLFGFGSDPTTPTLLKIGLEGGVKRLPKEIRTDIMGAREFLRTGAVEGRGYLTPVLESTVKRGGVAEFEAVIAPKTLLTQLKGRRQYTIVDGKRVPIKHFKTEKIDMVGEAFGGVETMPKMTVTKGKGTTAKELAKKYSRKTKKTEPYLRGDVSLVALPSSASKASKRVGRRPTTRRDIGIRYNVARRTQRVDKGRRAQTAYPDEEYPYVSDGGRRSGDGRGGGAPATPMYSTYRPYVGKRGKKMPWIKIGSDTDKKEEKFDKGMTPSQVFIENPITSILPPTGTVLFGAKTKKSTRRK